MAMGWASEPLQISMVMWCSRASVVCGCAIAIACSIAEKAWRGRREGCWNLSGQYESGVSVAATAAAQAKWQWRGEVKVEEETRSSRSKSTVSVEGTTRHAVWIM